MRKANWRSTAATVLLFALLMPILAACGGASTNQGGTAPTTAAEAPAPTTGTAAEAPTAAPANTEAPAAPAATTAPEAPAAGADTGTAEPGVLRINTGAEPENVDPQKSSFVSEIQFIMMNYQGLMTFDGEMQPVPGAAESVEASEDGLTYTFKIRPDSQYSDGTPLTARDFEYAWKRLANPETAGQYQSLPCGIIKGYSEYSASACQGLSITDTLALDLATLESEFGVRATDDQTLEIELVAPAPYFLSMAALWIGVPVRQADVETGEDWWYDAETYIGNGPFILTEWDHGNRAVWEPNPNYTGPLGPVKLQRVEYYMITEGQVAFQAYQNGELDMLAVAPEDFSAIQSDPNLSADMIEVPGSCSSYFGFNVGVAPFDQPEVRQAFSMAIDREAWVRDIFGGIGQVNNAFIPPGFPGFQEDLSAYTFDADAAKAKLAEAGYPNGEGLPEIRMSYGASARNNARFEWVASQFKENLGVDVVLDPVEPTAYTALLKEGSVPFYSSGWCADYPDPQNWVSLWQSNGVLSSRQNYSNPELDELVKQADVEQDPARRLELYAQAEEILINDVVFVPNRIDSGFVLIKPYVQGVSEDTITPIDYWRGFFNLPNVDVQP